MVKIEWTEAATKDLEKLDITVAQRVLKKIGGLSDNFGRIIPEPLDGEFKGAFKIRIGDWRVIYTVESQTLVIQFIGHRREIYNI